MAEAARRGSSHNCQPEWWGASTPLLRLKAFRGAVVATFSHSDEGAAIRAGEHAEGWLSADDHTEYLDPIPMRVVRVEAPVTGEAFIPAHAESTSCQLPGYGVDGLDEERRMRLLRRAEIRLYPHMKLVTRPAKPDSASGSERRRLANLRESQSSAIEVSH